MRVLQVQNLSQIEEIMRQIGVDPYGERLMAPKAMHCLIRINSLSNIAANILKQEMLSLGADAAVARGALTGKTKKTGCLLMADLSQYNRLIEKLKFQPFGLDKLAQELDVTLKNFLRDSFIVEAGRFKLRLGPGKTSIMGIVNVTPDSFSGDGLYYSSFGAIVDYAKKIVDDGADILDIGGESSRPQAKPVPLKKELTRVIPVIKLLAKKVKVPISIDTCKSEVAYQALDSGASMINDITGLENPVMRKLAARYKAAVIIMHMKGNPRTMQKNPQYTSVIDEIIDYLKCSILRAQEAGIEKEKIIVDPGIGFGKALEHNLEILKNLQDFKVLGKPILIGTSRKSFIGKILKVDVQERIFGSVASCLIAAQNGAKILRVHEVKETRQAIKIFEASLKS